MIIGLKTMSEFVSRDDQQKQIKGFRKMFESLWDKIQQETEESKEQDHCISKLEEALYWLNKTITGKD